MSYDLKITGGDLVIQNGSLKQVADSDKLIQDILKLCLTTAGSNPLAPWYGSFLSRTIVGTAMDSDILLQISRSQLGSALDNFKGLQDLQVQSLQYVTPDEQLGAVLDIFVRRNPNDYRLFDINIKAITKGLKPITTAFRVSTI